MTTLIDVIDTAVKIGLGALITGVTSYVLFKQKHTAESLKEYRSETRALIKELAVKLEDVESYINQSVVHFRHGDIKLARESMLPASKEVYMVRAFSNMLGDSDMTSTVNDLTCLIEEIYSKLSDTNVDAKKLEPLIVKTLPELKRAIYPYINKLYEESCA